MKDIFSYLKRLLKHRGSGDARLGSEVSPNEEWQVENRKYDDEENSDFAPESVLKWYNDN